MSMVRDKHELLSLLVGLAALAAAGAATAAEGARASCPEVTRVRFLPRKGLAKRMLRGRFTGSNEGPTTGFQTLAEIKEAPPEDEWTEIKVEKPQRFRYVKYESHWGGWGNVAEIEFYSGDTKLQGTPFGTAGSRDNSGNDFAKALDGNPETFFDGVGPNDQYVGIDLGAAVQTAPPTFLPEPGSYDVAQTVAIACATPDATIRIARNGGTPTREWGELYKGPIKLEAGTVLAAVAYTEHLAASPVAIAAYRIGQGRRDAKMVRTFHIGNSLTDTVVGWLQPVAESAGHKLDFHRFTIPGAPTEWLWHHPGGGFGDSRCAEAFFVLAPIDHLFTQPFAGHDRAIDNEADYSGRFFDLCRKHSPDVQLWLYVQWPGPKFDDRWAQGKGAVAKLKLKPAATWQEGVANHVAYTEAVRQLLDDTHEGKGVLIVPAGTALATLKTEVDAGRVPGMADFFKEMFADGIHLTAKGRYLVSLVHYACIFKESPEGKAAALTSGLTPEQVKVFQRIAWDTVKNYKWAGVAPLPPEAQ